MLSFVLAFAMAFPIGSALFRLLTGPDRAVARRRTPPPDAKPEGARRARAR